MPLYDYRCDDCGEFRVLRPMAESGAPAPCPSCRALCARALSAPFLTGAPQSGWLTGSQRGGSWRSACGFGCTHANCR